MRSNSCTLKLDDLCFMCAFVCVFVCVCVCVCVCVPNPNQQSVLHRHSNGHGNWQQKKKEMKISQIETIGCGGESNHLGLDCISSEKKIETNSKETELEIVCAHNLVHNQDL